MSKKQISALVLFIVCLIVICAGAAVKFVGDDGSASRDPQKQISEAIRSLNIADAFVISISPAAKPEISTPLSPVLFSQVTEGYVPGQDIQSGMFGNIRYESAGTTEEFKKREEKQPSPVQITIKDCELILPESPVEMNASVYYTHSLGVLPLTAIVSWDNLSGQTFENWEKPLIQAGFEKSDETVVSLTDGDAAVKASVYRLPSAGATAEIVYKENLADNKTKKKTDESREVTRASLFIISELEGKIKAYLDRINAAAIDAIVSQNEFEGREGGQDVGIAWRRPYVISDYRYINTSRVYGIDFATLNDRTMLNTSIPVYSTIYESWGGIPIGWSWLVYRNDWEGIKEKFIEKTLGLNNVADSDLADGVRSEDDIFLKTEIVAGGNSESQILKVNIVDKQTDNIISTIFDYFNIVDVQGLRNSQAQTIRAQKNK